MNDLISREAAIKAIKTAELGMETEAIKVLPSVQSERTVGKWIEIPDTIFASKFRCSVCGKSPLIECCEYALTNFCPNCGARMEE